MPSSREPGESMHVGSLASFVPQGRESPISDIRDPEHVIRAGDGRTCLFAAATAPA